MRGMLFAVLYVLSTSIALAEPQPALTQASPPPAAVEQKPAPIPMEPVKIIVDPDNGLPQFICQPTTGVCIACPQHAPCWLYRPSLQRAKP
jgi:hypothetical protein